MSNFWHQILENHFVQCAHKICTFTKMYLVPRGTTEDQLQLLRKHPDVLREMSSQNLIVVNSNGIFTVKNKQKHEQCIQKNTPFMPFMPFKPCTHENAGKSEHYFKNIIQKDEYDENIEQLNSDDTPHKKMSSNVKQFSKCLKISKCQALLH